MANPTDQKEVLRLEGIEEHRLGKGTPFSRTYLKIVDSMDVLRYKYVHAATARRPMGTDSGPWSGGADPRPPPRDGRTPVPARTGLEAVLWMLNTGAQWHLLPPWYPHDKTVPRRFQQWGEREVLREILTQRATTLREEGASDERERVLEATLAAANGGKILAIVDRHGLPLSVSTHAANHHEVTLVPLSVDSYMLEAKPEPRIIGDRADDSDGLDTDRKQDGVNLIAPPRAPRTLNTQDGRPLRRDQRRWLVERFLAWLQGKRRWLVRGEYDASHFLGFVQLASITMLLKQF